MESEPIEDVIQLGAKSLTHPEYIRGDHTQVSWATGMLHVDHSESNDRVERLKAHVDIITGLV